VTNIQMWSLVVGAGLPPFIAILQQPSWSRAARSVVTVLVCLIAGAVTSYLRGDWTLQAVTTTVLTILVTAMATYQSFWKTTVAPAIEAGSSPGNNDSPALHSES
jgi:hypothetical protein